MQQGTAEALVLARSLTLISALCLAAAPLLTGCSWWFDDPAPPDPEPQGDGCAPAPVCDESIVIAPDSPALIITDPVALSKLPLEDVLSRLLKDFNEPPTTPTDLLRMMFDTNNNTGAGVYDHIYHCDDPDNPAHDNGGAAMCPRAEGALALSDGFFTPGHKNHFYPVAVINRFDLTPADRSSCGEFRIIYAKESGKTDPNDRVFLIFEPPFENPEPWCEHSCRPVAEFWRDLEKAESSEALGDKLRQFFLDFGAGFPSVIRRNAFDSTNTPSPGGYYGARGQVRVSQHIDEHWELREFAYRTGYDGPAFEPKTVGNNPFPGSFKGYVATTELTVFDERFLDNVELLARRNITNMGMLIDSDYLAGESEQGGDQINDYALAAQDNLPLHNAMDDRIAQLELGADCPPDDPLTSEAILRRATMMSCAGCHAPSRFLGPERKLGCGVTWPDSLGDVHVDEFGNLSPALKEVFLPHRAEVLTTYLQGCDMAKIEANMGGPFGSAASELSAGPRLPTLGGSVTH